MRVIAARATVTKLTEVRNQSAATMQEKNQTTVMTVLIETTEERNKIAATEGANLIEIETTDLNPKEKAVNLKEKAPNLKETTANVIETAARNPKVALRKTVTENIPEKPKEMTARLPEGSTRKIPTESPVINSVEEENSVITIKVPARVASKNSPEEQIGSLSNQKSFQGGLYVDSVYQNLLLLNSIICTIIKLSRTAKSLPSPFRMTQTPTGKMPCLSEELVNYLRQTILNSGYLGYGGSLILLKFST